MPRTYEVHDLPARVRGLLPVIEKGVREGLSSRRIQEAIRQSGAGVRRADLLEAMRRVSGAQASMPILKNIPRNRSPDPSRLPYATTPMRSNYSYLVEFRGFDRNGEVMQKGLWVSSNSPSRTRQQIENRAMELYARKAYWEGFTIEEAIMTEGVRAGAKGIV